MGAGKLFLSGGGGKNDSKLLDEMFAKCLDKKKILYIPIAMLQTEHSFAECHIWIKSVFKDFGISDITMWTDLSGKKYEDLSGFEAIYIGGGNTFKLMDDLKKSKFDKFLKIFFVNGGIIYGGSAGAIILGDDIGTSSDNNDVGLKDLSGMKLLKGFSIWCHYKAEHDELLFDYVRNKKIPTIAIPEKSGIVFDEGKITIVGFESVFLFADNKKISFSPGSIVEQK